MRPHQPMIVVTGAAGMIGSGVVRYLNDLGMSDLLLVDDLGSGEKWKNLRGKQFVDLISRHALFDWLQGKNSEIGAVVHLGACSDTTETNADYLLENNFRFSVRLAEWALTLGKRFIYASSAATYGDGLSGFCDDEESLESLYPLNMYGFSKHLVDLWMKREKVLDRVVGLKYFNVFGPNEYHKGNMASMVFKMTQRAAEEKVIGLYKSNEPDRFADGEQCRDFLYLKDAVRMTCAFLEPRYRHVGGIYNIGSGHTTTWNQLAHYLFCALQQPTQITYIDLPAALQNQYQNYTCADMRKFHKIVSIPQPRPIEESVHEYVGHYLLKNGRW